MSRLLHNVTKSHQKKCVCPYCACTYFNYQETYLNHIEKKHPYIENEFMCKKCLNMFHLEEAMQFHHMICIVKEREAHMVEYPAFNCPIKWVERDNYVEPNSNLDCGRL